MSEFEWYCPMHHLVDFLEGVGGEEYVSASDYIYTCKMLKHL